jgi:hypothetical protein
VCLRTQLNRQLCQSRPHLDDHGFVACVWQSRTNARSASILRGLRRTLRARARTRHRDPRCHATCNAPRLTASVGHSRYLKLTLRLPAGGQVESARAYCPEPDDARSVLQPQDCMLTAFSSLANSLGHVMWSVYDQRWRKIRPKVSLQRF